MSARASSRPPKIDTHLVELVLSRTEQHLSCDLCGTVIEGEPAGRGCFIWTRGDEVRLEEPALCDHCAQSVYAAATRRWLSEDEEN